MSRSVERYENSPATISPTMASPRRLRTSSKTAAPMMALAASVWSLPISLSTLAVIAMLVAIIAVATNRALPKS